MVAGGGAPLAIGTDIGGSIRIPSSFCGVPGIKPTPNRITLGGTVSPIPGQEGVSKCAGPIGKDVEGVALAFSALVGSTSASLDPYVSPLPFDEQEFASSKPMTIGYYDFDGFQQAHPALERSLDEAVGALKARGHTLVKLTVPDGYDTIHTLLGLLTPDVGATITALMDGSQMDPGLVPVFRLASMSSATRYVLGLLLSCIGQTRMAGLVRCAGKRSVAEYWRLVSKRDKIKQQWADMLVQNGVQAVLSPSHTMVAPTIGTPAHTAPSCSYTMVRSM